MLDDDGNNQFETIGSTETSMAKIMGSKAQTYTAELEHQGVKTKRGTIIVRAESLEHSSKVCHFHVRGLNLPNTRASCCMGSTILPVHYELLKASPNDLNTFRSIYKSSVI